MLLDTSVRTGGDYGVTVRSTTLPRRPRSSARRSPSGATPASPRHDNSRGWACLREGVEAYEGETCQAPNPRPTIPLLTLPTSCTGALSTSLAGIAWSGEQLGGQYTLQNNLGTPLETLENCSRLPFKPSLEIQPEQTRRTTRPARANRRPARAPRPDCRPTSRSPNRHAHKQRARRRRRQERERDAARWHAAEPRRGERPAGLLRAADRLSRPGRRTDPLSPGAREPLRFSPPRPAARKPRRSGPSRSRHRCSAKNCTARSISPTPAPNGEAGQNPFNRLIALYILAENETLGLRVKLAGEGELNEQTGQITTSFKNTPQVPFEELKLQLFGGPARTAHDPRACGGYTATSSLHRLVRRHRSTRIRTGVPDHQRPRRRPLPCSPLPFAPSFQAGATSPQAGAFTRSPSTLTQPRRRPAPLGPDDAPARWRRCAARSRHTLPRTPSFAQTNAARKA